MSYKVCHLNVAQTFTKAGYGEPSDGFMRLEKAIYGPRQSGLLSNDLLIVKLVTVHGMQQCTTDPCVLRLIRARKVVVILTVHVDDMVVTCPRGEVGKLLLVLNEDFTTNDFK